MVQTLFAAAPNPAGWYHQAVVVSYAATDALAGLASPANGSYTFSTSGAGQTYAFNVADLAGNMAAATVGPVNVDLTAPAVTVLAAPGYLRPDRQDGRGHGHGPIVSRVLGDRGGVVPRHRLAGLTVAARGRSRSSRTARIRSP